MNKPYYTCALAAAYMAREFGVLIGQWRKESGVFFSKVGWLLTPIGSVIKGKDKLYIHPDSFHIFKPQAGDIATDTADGGISLHISGDKKQLYSYTLGCDPMKIEQHEIKDLVIILRNKKPFFWPEGM